MKSKFTLLALLLTLNMSAQKRTFLDYRNEATPTYPGCENAENKEDCFREKVGGLILEKINKYNSTTPLNTEDIKINVTIYNKETGESTYKVVIENEKIKELALSALKDLPVIEPITDLNGNPVTSSYGFYVILQLNKTTKQYEQVIKSTTQEMKKKPHPFPMKIEDAHFKDCPKEDQFVTTCFQEKFNQWITKEMGDKLNSFKGQKAKIKLTIDEEGKVSVSGIKTDSEKLEAAIKKAFNNFPQMEPAVVNDNISKMTYDVPISF